MRKSYISSLVVLLFLLFIARVSEARAQIVSSGVAVSMPIQGENIQDGDIVCSTQEGNVLCSIEYDSSMFGVITTSSAMSLTNEGEENSHLVINNGKVVVRVTSANGNIEEGDLITTSEITGVGMRALRNGFVLGVAQEGYSSDNTEEVGKILVTLNIHPAVGLAGLRSNLLEAIRRGFDASYLEPLATLRYIIAALVALASFVIGFVYFGRMAKAGIEAIGRNPMAKFSIEVSVLLHILVTIVIVGVGLFISYLILVL